MRISSIVAVQHEALALAHDPACLVVHACAHGWQPVGHGEASGGLPRKPSCVMTRFSICIEPT